MQPLCRACIVYAVHEMHHFVHRINHMNDDYSWFELVHFAMMMMLNVYASISDVMKSKKAEKKMLRKCIHCVVAFYLLAKIVRKNTHKSFIKSSGSNRYIVVVIVTMVNLTTWAFLYKKKTSWEIRYRKILVISLWFHIAKVDKWKSDKSILLTWWIWHDFNSWKYA